MSDLYLTKTRAALLLAAHAGNVVDGHDEDGNIHTWLIEPPYQPRKVNGQINAARRAGWVEWDAHVWRLTDAGCAALDANGGWGWSQGGAS